MKQKGQSADGWHHFIEASFLAYADRNKFVGDPRFVDVPTEAMLGKDYLASRAALIKPDSAIGTYTAGDPARFLRGADATPDDGGTSHFTVIDKDGLIVSMTTTIEGPLGSQRMVGGFMLNNQLTDFSFKSVDDNGVGMIDWGLTPQQAADLPNVIARRGRVRMEAKGLKDETTNEIIRTGPAATFGMSPDIISESVADSLFKAAVILS